MAVRHHQRPARKSVEALIAAHHGVRGVINVERINQTRTAREQRQTARGGTLQNTLDQLGIARTPHQVRTQRTHAQNPATGQGSAVRLQRQKLSGSLRTRIVTARMLRGRHAGTVTHNRRTGMSHRRRRNVQERTHRMVQRRLQQGAGALNIDALIISPLATDRNLRRGMHHAVHAGHRQIHSLRVRNIAAHLLKTGTNRIRQKRRNTRIATLKNAHIITGTQQRQHALTTQQAARTGKEDALANTRREIRLLNRAQRTRGGIGVARRQRLRRLAEPRRRGGHRMRGRQAGCGLVGKGLTRRMRGHHTP